MTGDPLAFLRLPDSEVASGYRDSLGHRCHFRVDELGASIAAVAPAEGPGAIGKHFGLLKLCDANSDLADPEVWRPIREHPPRKRTDIADPDVYLAEMLARGLEIREDNPGTEAEIAAFALAALGAAETGSLPELLAVNMPVLLENFPKGSLWLVTVGEVVLARMAFGRTQLALQLNPDMPMGPDMEQLGALSGLSLTRGVDFTSTLNLPLLVLSPGVLGLQIPALPHSLVFCFGGAVDLRRRYPWSLSSLYRPSVLTDPEGADRTEYLAAEGGDDGPELLAWWVDRLNVIYSHATDPTRFTDGDGYYDAPAQTAWMITVERLMADALALLSEPQAPEMDRVQLAFDLLDKAEALLGYGKAGSGDGFVALLRQAQSSRRARAALESLPGDLGTRIADEVARLFTEMKQEIRGKASQYRLTPKGIKIAKDDAATLRSISNDDFVSTLCRVVRNSSHGLLSILHEDRDRFVLAAHSGDIPAELPALAPLLALSLLADVESLIDGTWRDKLLGNTAPSAAS